MMMTVKKGHRLETMSVRGGIIAQCSCGEIHKPPKPPDVVLNGQVIKRPESQVWSTWSRDKIKEAHRAHVEGLDG